MPQTSFNALDITQTEQASNYAFGYYWIPGRFGPPPGILKSRKDELDRMSDKEYLYAFLKLSQDEKESLMISEAERRRTFAAHWPIEQIVKAHDCAKEGFYYTGVSDRVQCALCGGIIRNWERGDVPKFKHKSFFNYCKLVLNKPCLNLPISICGLGLGTSQISIAVRAGDSGNEPRAVGNLNINTVRPKNPEFSVFSKRMATYRRYPDNNPVSADKLGDAGFLYEGTEDKVKCFWCNGALEGWTKGDDPWVEHAKWYPGCTYVQQAKGLDFIRKARSQMTKDNLTTAESLLYNNGGVDFLENNTPPAKENQPIQYLEGYTFCSDLGYNQEHIEKAYRANNDVEFDQPSILVTIVQQLAEGNEMELEELKRTVACKAEQNAQNGTALSTTTQSRRRVNVPKLLTHPNDPSEQECKDLIDGLKCKICKRNTSGALVLPCGCFCLCQECSRKNLPPRCPACASIVNGSCRAFLS